MSAVALIVMIEQVGSRHSRKLSWSASGRRAWYLSRVCRTRRYFLF